MSKSAQPFDYRGANGQYIVGNPGGPGNPHARNVAQLRAAVNAAVSVNMVGAVMQHLYELALKSNIPAARLFLQYAVGKPAPAESPDEVEVQEWKLRREGIVSEEEMMTMVHNVPVDVANCVVQMSDISGRTILHDEMEKAYGVNTWNVNELTITHPDFGGKRKARGQQSGDRGQEAGGRGQEPGGRGQEAGGRAQESGGRGQEQGKSAEQTVRAGEPVCEAVRAEQTVTATASVEQTARASAPVGVSPGCDAARKEQTVRNGENRAPSDAVRKEQTVRDGERVA